RSSVYPCRNQVSTGRDRIRRPQTGCSGGFVERQAMIHEARHAARAPRWRTQSTTGGTDTTLEGVAKATLDSRGPRESSAAAGEGTGLHQRAVRTFANSVARIANAAL